MLARPRKQGLLDKRYRITAVLEPKRQIRIPYRLCMRRGGLSHPQCPQVRQPSRKVGEPPHSRIADWTASPRLPSRPLLPSQIAPRASRCDSSDSCDRTGPATYPSAATVSAKSKSSEPASQGSVHDARSQGSLQRINCGAAGPGQTITRRSSSHFQAAIMPPPSRSAQDQDHPHPSTDDAPCTPASVQPQSGQKQPQSGSPPREPLP